MNTKKKIFTLFCMYSISANNSSFWCWYLDCRASKKKGESQKNAGL